MVGCKRIIEFEKKERKCIIPLSHFLPNFASTVIPDESCVSVSMLFVSIHFMCFNGSHSPFSSMQYLTKKHLFAAILKFTIGHKEKNYALVAVSLLCFQSSNEVNCLVENCFGRLMYL